MPVCLDGVVISYSWTVFMDQHEAKFIDCASFFYSAFMEYSTGIIWPNQFFPCRKWYRLLVWREQTWAAWSGQSDRCRPEPSYSKKLLITDIFNSFFYACKDILCIDKTQYKFTMIWIYGWKFPTVILLVKELGLKWGLNWLIDSGNRKRISACARVNTLKWKQKQRLRTSCRGGKEKKVHAIMCPTLLKTLNLQKT